MHFYLFYRVSIFDRDVNKNTHGFFAETKLTLHVDARAISAEILTILTGAALNSGRISETMGTDFCIIRHHSLNFAEKSITAVIPSREIFLARVHFFPLTTPVLPLPFSLALSFLPRSRCTRKR